ncbi:hypothetical protein M409DRAFT_18173 [Zasmidium cellare ATCC 36951]|uniref:Heterokaryon incompatibility domain-containing protein n=1 Tax=Zasmidium cellare ATCC 36951 TaxID=1080233 RepID=A0A6A6D1A4_ZASCE|nr:uncharacterized protein M409DRAFT_18173 [Zasmidium cellare ATCC 36951]KAF2171942.1 hypothetical protein M409DRAFT_18173 [Zasmidium cellare ATCC 36951]
MRLLNVDTLELCEFGFNGLPTPHYVTASHRWTLGSETTFKDVLKRRNTETPGYKKVEAFAAYIRTNIPSIKWLWIDTCCIDQKSTAELSEAVNLMYEWFKNSVMCLAYLADVEDSELGQINDSDESDIATKSEFEQSVWFTRRGWTLQELLAPKMVIFLTKEWRVIGHKGHKFGQKCDTVEDTEIGTNVETLLARRTGISVGDLVGPYPRLHRRDEHLKETMKWMEGRKTTRPEDKIYALYGILGVSPGANYGEGYPYAYSRLLKAVKDYHAHVHEVLAESKRRIIARLPPPSKDDFRAYASGPKPKEIHDRLRRPPSPAERQPSLAGEKINNSIPA